MTEATSPCWFRRGHTLDIGVAGEFSRGATPLLNGTIRLDAASGVGGIATSGARGRSFSLGIADSVTTLARDAASADVAATLIANAVSVDSPAIRRRPARELDPDSDLRDLPVTVSVGPLTAAEVDAALSAGLRRAAEYRRRGLIIDAALMLAGRDAHARRCSQCDRACRRADSRLPALRHVEDMPPA